MDVDPKRELDLLLTSIEETSKHARKIMSLLLIACTYVLITMVSETEDAQLKLPIVDNIVSKDQFFSFSPLVILILYHYLNMYIMELKNRLDVYAKFELSFKNIPYKEMILFPWILTFSRKSNYAESITSTLLLLLGPSILFFMWLSFLREHNIVSIIPSICFIISLYSFGRYLSDYRIFFFLSGIISMITLSHVEDLRQILFINTAWVYLSISTTDAVLLFTHIYFSIYIILLWKDKQSFFHDFTHAGPGWIFLLVAYIPLTLALGISLYI